MSDITERLRAWDPPMAQYHGDLTSLGQSTARAVHEHGLSQLRLNDPKLLELQVRHQLGGTIERLPWYVHAGSIIGDRISGEKDRRRSYISYAPPELLSRRSNAYKRFELDAFMQGREAVILAHEHRRIEAAWDWLCSDNAMTSMKRAFRLAMTGTTRWPEVSHRWQPDGVEPFAGDGIVDAGPFLCRLREDVVLYQESSGVWATIQIKCTTKRLKGFFPWQWRKYNFWAASWYNRGLTDLLGFEPAQYLLVICLTPPYEIGFERINRDTPLPGATRSGNSGQWSGSEELAMFWNDTIEPTLRQIREALNTGRLWGPEERWTP